MISQLKLIALLWLSLVASTAWATMPIRATITIGDLDGWITGSACCRVSVPENEVLLTIRKGENCRSGGTPVGRFELVDGKLWLVGLLACKGAIPLRDVYPESTGPVVASWLTGTFDVQLMVACPPEGGSKSNRARRELTLRDGIDVSTAEQTTLVSDCATAPE